LKSEVYHSNETTQQIGNEFGNWPNPGRLSPSLPTCEYSIIAPLGNVVLIRTIAADFAEPAGMERTVVVFCGRTGTGKSRRAWEEAGLGAYPKDPRTKFWDGYRDQSHVVIGNMN